MNPKLVAWANAVKARGKGKGLPPVWFFTDAARLADPRPVAARLPKGLCGVVFRHDGLPSRAAMGRDLARLCRARRNLLLVAGDWKLAHSLNAGLHLRGGRPLPRGRRSVPMTSSAHNQPEVIRARRAGAGAIFVGPVFATASHPGREPLGPLRFAGLSRVFSGARFALGGISAETVRRVRADGFGAIGGFLRIP